MPSNLPQFTIRVNSELLGKLKYVAGYSARSANREIEMLIRRHVDEFESIHGEITLDSEKTKQSEIKPL